MQPSFTSLCYKCIYPNFVQMLEKKVMKVKLFSVEKALHCCICKKV